MKTARIQIPACPAAGEGVHRWILEAAHAARRGGMTQERAATEIESRMTRHPNSRTEIADAVAKAFAGAPMIWSQSPAFSKAPKWPAPNLEQIEAASASGLGVVDLWEQSPVRWDDNTPRTSELLGRLFGGDDPWLCIGSNTDFFTERLSKIIKPEQFPLIVPSGMLDKYGMTQDGRRSQHTLSNTGPRRFFVVEFDGIGRDTQAAVLLHLSERAPLAMVVDSGGKSLHGWIFVAGKTDEQLRLFFQRVCALGADPAAIRNRSQFVRMPDGRRDNGNRQSVLFFNPERLTK
jgi:hypothetical protein